MSKAKEDRVVGTVQPVNSGQNFNIEVPSNLVISYTDFIHMTTNEYGIVLDFGQRMGPTNKVGIVSRVGMSREHAEALKNLLVNELSKKKG